MPELRQLSGGRKKAAQGREVQQPWISVEGFRVLGLGFRVLGFRGLGFRGLGFSVLGLGV